MKALICLAVAAFVLIGLGCSDAPTATPLTGSIVGKVRMFDKHGVVMSDNSGATITLLGTKTYTTTTKLDGSFRFNNVDAGIYRLTKSAPNQLTDTSQYQIQFVGNGELDVSLLFNTDFQRAWYSKTLTCTVHILDKRGNEIYDSSGIQIRVFNNTGISYTFNEHRIVWIDSIPDGNYSIVAMRDGYEYDSTGVKIFNDINSKVEMTVFKLPKLETTIFLDSVNAHSTSVQGNTIDSIRVAFHGELSDTDNSDIYYIKAIIKDSIGRTIDEIYNPPVIRGRIIHNQIYTVIHSFGHTTPDYPLFRRFRTHNIQFVCTSKPNYNLVNKRLPNPNNNTSISMSNTLKVVVP